MQVFAVPARKLQIRTHVTNAKKVLPIEVREVSLGNRVRIRDLTKALAPGY